MDCSGVFSFLPPIGIGFGIGFTFGDRDNTARKIGQTLKSSSVRQIGL